MARSSIAATWRFACVAIAGRCGLEWWTHKGSNLGPLPCEGNALPLSYASGNSAKTEPAPRQSPRFTKCGAAVSSDQSAASDIRAKPGRITPPAGGRGRRATAAPGCARRACRRLRRRRRCAADAIGGLGRGLRHGAGSAASMASIGEFGPSSCIASLATSAAMSLMRSRSSAFSMRSVAQELSACCWIALMSRCSLARSSRAMRSCSSTAAFSARSFSNAGDLPPFVSAAISSRSSCAVRSAALVGLRAAGCFRIRARPAACPGWRAALPDR